MTTVDPGTPVGKINRELTSHPIPLIEPHGPRFLVGAPLSLLTSSIATFGCSGRDVTHSKSIFLLQIFLLLDFFEFLHFETPVVLPPADF